MRGSFARTTLGRVLREVCRGDFLNIDLGISFFLSINTMLIYATHSCTLDERIRCCKENSI